MAVNAGQIHGGFRLFEKLFPATPLESLTSEPLDVLRARYRGRDRVGNVVMVVAFLGLTAAYYGLILALVAAVVRPNLPPGTRHVLGNSTIEYVACAGFLSLFSSTALVLFVLRLVLGREEYRLYMAYGARRLPRPVDVGKLFGWMAAVVFVPLAVWVACYLTTYTAFTDRALVESPFGSFGRPRRTLRYADIRGVYLVHRYHARFKDVASPSFVIVFKDGSRWKTDPATPRVFEEQLPVIEDVVRLSGAPAFEVNFPEDVPR